jgi:hypothetical protein
MRYATRTHEEGIEVRLPDANDEIKRAPVKALRAVFSGVGQLLLAADRLREEDAKAELESGADQPDTLASWDGTVSSSVRLLTPGGTPAPSKSKPADRRSEPKSRKSEPAARKSARAAASKPGQPAEAKARPADAKRAAAKAGNTGNARKAARQKTVAEPARFRSLDLTGNVRMLTDQDITDLATDRFERDIAEAEAQWPGDSTQEPAPADPEAGSAAPLWAEAAPSWSSWSTSAPEVPSGVLPPVPELPIGGYDELSLPSLRARLRGLGSAQVRELLAHERSHANRTDVVSMFERRIVKLEEAVE